MKDYEVKLTLTVPITARSRPETEERAEKLAAIAMGALIDRVRWAGDCDYDHEVIEIKP